MRYPTSPTFPTKGDPDFRSASQDPQETPVPPEEAPLPGPLPPLTSDVPDTPTSDFKAMRSLLASNVIIHYITFESGFYFWWTEGNGPHISSFLQSEPHRRGTIHPHRPKGLRFCFNCAAPIPKGLKGKLCSKCRNKPLSKDTIRRMQKTKIRRFSGATS